MRVRDFDSQSSIQHALIMRLHKRCGKEGIVIPYPIRTVFMKEHQAWTVYSGSRPPLLKLLFGFLSLSMLY